MTTNNHCDAIFRRHDIFKNEKGEVDTSPLSKLNEKLKLEPDGKVRYQMFLDFQKKFRENIKNMPRKDRWIGKAALFRTIGDYEWVDITYS
jgi:hypothetical protein